MRLSLYPYQAEAIGRMKTGSILCGGVGSGKSRTSLAYYYTKQGYSLDDICPDDAPDFKPKDLYIITTARKRDTKEWDGELLEFMLFTDISKNYHGNKVVVDSWNNIGKYKDVEHSFFIFDEQRVVGKGAWVKSFLQIAKWNEWILLSATPGDTWMDYVPVFIANGFYRNRTEFDQKHVRYSRFSKFPKVESYVGTKRLEHLRNDILVHMDYMRPTETHHHDIMVDYDVFKYRNLARFRWNSETQMPIVNASELCYELRKIVNSSFHRQSKLMELVEERRRVIIFYNYNYELEILRSLPYSNSPDIAEWNGHNHDPVPDGDDWIYLVQYSAGAEGWNCITTDTIIFYSQNYSYKIMVQACGRIDRLNTPFTDLYYYHLKSSAPIDKAIALALRNKKKFNERKFIGVA